MIELAHNKYKLYDYTLLESSPNYVKNVFNSSNVWVVNDRKDDEFSYWLERIRGQDTKEYGVYKGELKTKGLFKTIYLICVQ